METLFYVIGGALVLVALAISALGMRNDDFPSTGVMRIGVLLVALVVVATAYTAVGSAQDEQEAREAEENHEAALEAEEAEEEAEASGEVETPAPDEQGQGPGPVEPETGGATASVEQGRAVFVEQGCGSCHTLTDLGDQALGTIGPNLDVELVDEDAAYIETSIVDPSAFVVEGFGDNIMPTTYAEDIGPVDLDALVAYLDEVAGAEGATGTGGGAAGASAP